METKGITRSRRYYTPKDSNKPNKPKNKGNAIEEEGLVQVPLKKIKPVTKEEAFKFLKIIKYNEYNIIKQLKKMPARISLLSFILTSKPHR